MRRRCAFPSELDGPATRLNVPTIGLQFHHHANRDASAFFALAACL